MGRVVLRCEPVPPRLRYWLVDAPLTVWSWALAWYRLYWLILGVLGAIVLPLMVLSMLVLWFGFGIRWGW